MRPHLWVESGDDVSSGLFLFQVCSFRVPFGLCINNRFFSGTGAAGATRRTTSSRDNSGSKACRRCENRCSGGEGWSYSGDAADRAATAARTGGESRSSVPGRKLSDAPCRPWQTGFPCIDGCLLPRCVSLRLAVRFGAKLLARLGWPFFLAMTMAV